LVVGYQTRAVPAAERQLELQRRHRAEGAAKRRFAGVCLGQPEPALEEKERRAAAKSAIPSMSSIPQSRAHVAITSTFTSGCVTRQRSRSSSIRENAANSPRIAPSNPSCSLITPELCYDFPPLYSLVALQATPPLGKTFKS
jgi:hypothetical protein